MLAPSLLSLSSLPLLNDFETGSISAGKHDRSRGGRTIPKGGPVHDLSASWKAHPFITIEPKSSITLDEVQGSGMIQDI
jgi:hypothetical protein